MNKKAGRPATGLKRNKQVSFRLSEEEYNLIKKKAEDAKLSINQYLFKKLFSNIEWKSVDIKLIKCYHLNIETRWTKKQPYEPRKLTTVVNENSRKQVAFCTLF